MRKEIYDHWGDALYDQFAKLRPELEAWLKGDDESDSEESDDEDNPAARKAVPEKRRKRLRIGESWLRDKLLMEVVRMAQQEMGADVFDDHNVFRSRFEAVMKERKQKRRRRWVFTSTQPPDLALHLLMTTARKISFIWQRLLEEASVPLTLMVTPTSTLCLLMVAIPWSGHPIVLSVFCYFDARTLCSIDPWRRYPALHGRATVMA
ncbi:MAG: hypothetical protein KA744_15745, partial [Phenylobacterium sp.]|nr:hypothetical protein [Phenylobacterium sp.]